ncbi:Hypothetical predicted protein [Mytilus galloprovincialis]|uniref:Uncharacterized protein n=1 Tax=Mytilus galloprovincialis TaxID=29158 RepID=A0A8B6ELV5_MYTGA|nr:Hypothetical predicted protein [Mytilus galloprovincialis]
MDGAALVSVNTLVEHQFVSQWLMANDPAINTWYTSGVIDEETLKMRWEGDGMDIEPGMQYWLNNDHKDKSGDHIVYTYGVVSLDFLRRLIVFHSTSVEILKRTVSQELKPSITTVM